MHGQTQLAETRAVAETPLPLVLVVDDCPDDREHVTRLLNATAACTHASGFETALTAIAAREPDCVLLDYAMPGLNGLDVLRSLLNRYPFLPIVMMTDNGNETIAVQAIKDGAQDYLVKSQLTGDILRRHIQAAVEHCRIRRDGEAMRRDRDRLSAVIEQSPDFIAMADLKGRLIHVNASAREMLGIGPDDALDTTLSGLFQGTVARRITTEALPTLRARGQWKGEGTFIRGDGEEIAVSQVLTLQRDDKGAPCGLATIIRDISDIKAHEAALKVSEETFRAVMEYATIGMGIISATGRWLRVNPALCRLFGYSEIVMLANDFPSILHPEDRDTVMALWARVAGGETESVQSENRYHRWDCRVIWAHVSLSLVRHPDGRPNFVVAQFEDVTERREVERMKTEFISVVSHELRTPLTSIRGSLGLLNGAHADALTDKARRLVQLAYDNSDRLILLINDILDIDKISSGHMRFDMQEQDLSLLVRNAVEANQPYAAKFNVFLVSAPVPPHLRLTVDAARFHQVLNNLISNAIKFSPPGETVTLAVSSIGADVTLSVVDRGAGIPEEFRARVFGKFSQADSSATRQAAGTGLGLHISQQIVEHMGGQIGFESTLGVGTVFWVTFPRAGAVQRRDSDSGDAGAPFSMPAPGTLPHILHVEDDGHLSQFIASALSGRATVTPAATLKAARTLAGTGAFDMILLDVSMPDGNGLKWLDTLARAGVKLPPVVVLSGRDLPRDLKSPVEATLIKSRDPEARMIETICTVLDGAQARRVAT
ncbi:PAS domain S-box protein [Asticcacaulis solisilvae]|uniref:PAS domain S-box protein n=1 Tax=Asticcacaulis solisilvae TaxID=1217274 RepID=UPI003FD6EC34